MLQEPPGADAGISSQAAGTSKESRSPASGGGYCLNDSSRLTARGGVLTAESVGRAANALLELEDRFPAARALSKVIAGCGEGTAKLAQGDERGGLYNLCEALGNWRIVRTSQPGPERKWPAGTIPAHLQEMRDQITTIFDESIKFALSGDSASLVKATESVEQSIFLANEAARLSLSGK